MSSAAAVGAEPAAAARSVVLGQEHRCRAAIGLGDSPELGAVLRVVGGEQAEASVERELVLACLFLVEIATVTGDVPRQRGRDVGGGEVIEGLGGVPPRGPGRFPIGNAVPSVGNAAAPNRRATR